MPKTWFITGSSRGLGREFARAALDRGDRVAATARSTEALRGLGDPDRLLTLPLDVTNAVEAQRAVTAVVDHFGTLDVVVNNAAGGSQGPAVEELTDESLRDTVEVNFFGAVNVTRAVLPVLRRQGRGHIVQVSSMGGLVGLPFASAYIASKWALEGWTESLAHEVKGLGIAVTLIEPTAFDTGADHGSRSIDGELDEYRAMREAAGDHGGPPPEDPSLAARALLRIVDAENPPLRAIFGTGGTQFIAEVYQQRMDVWESLPWP